MTDSFMTTEGDRSGTATPTPREKAKNLVRAAALALAKLEAEWDTLDGVAVDDQIAEVEATLFRAGQQIARD
jgi:hypothetical protein